jgi:DMSO/TMAO reductase YedYZ molybdopterin-dependent catalytic subunit
MSLISAPPRMNRRVRPFGKDARVQVHSEVPFNLESSLDLLADGQELPQGHGSPVRLVVPGWGGINWVKWIVGMTVLDHESLSSYNYFMANCRHRRDHLGVSARERSAGTTTLSSWG